MLFEDTLLALGILVATFVGAGFVRYQQRKSARGKLRQAREHGERNAATADAKAEMVCEACDKATDPSADVYTHGAWWHVGCYESMIKSN